MGGAVVGSGVAAKKGSTNPAYAWGAERPSVIERRVQLRKKTLALRKEEVRKALAAELDARIAAIEAEERKSDEKLALVAQHRQAVSERKKAMRVTRTYRVSNAVYTDEEIAAVREKHPDITDDQARLILDALAIGEVSNDGIDQAETPRAPSPQSYTDDGVPQKLPGRKTRDVAPVEAAVSIVSDANVLDIRTIEVGSPALDSGEGAFIITALSDHTSSSEFDPVSWVDGDPVPKGYISRLMPEGHRELFPDPAYMDVEEPTMTPELRRLSDLRQEVYRREREILATYGNDADTWPEEVQMEADRLYDEGDALSVEISKLLGRA